MATGVPSTCVLSRSARGAPHAAVPATLLSATTVYIPLNYQISVSWWRPGGRGATESDRCRSVPRRPRRSYRDFGEPDQGLENPSGFWYLGGGSHDGCIACCPLRARRLRADRLGVQAAMEPARPRTIAVGGARAPVASENVRPEARDPRTWPARWQRDRDPSNNSRRMEPEPFARVLFIVARDQRALVEFLHKDLVAEDEGLIEIRLRRSRAQCDGIPSRRKPRAARPTPQPGVAGESPRDRLGLGYASRSRLPRRAPSITPSLDPVCSSQVALGRSCSTSMRRGDWPATSAEPDLAGDHANATALARASHSRAASRSMHPETARPHGEGEGASDGAHAV